MDQSARRNTPELLQRKIISPSAANPESSEIMLEGSGVKTTSVHTPGLFVTLT